MLAPLIEPDNRVITDLLLFHCWPRRRGQRWPEHSLNVAISTRECYWTAPRDHRTHPPADGASPEAKSAVFYSFFSVPIAFWHEFSGMCPTPTLSLRVCAPKVSSHVAW